MASASTGTWRWAPHEREQGGAKKENLPQNQAIPRQRLWGLHDPYVKGWGPSAELGGGVGAPHAELV